LQPLVYMGDIASHIAKIVQPTSASDTKYKVKYLRFRGDIQKYIEGELSPTEERVFIRESFLNKNYNQRKNLAQIPSFLKENLKKNNP
jgi:hypothetical protein